MKTDSQKKLSGTQLSELLTDIIKIMAIANLVLIVLGCCYTHYAKANTDVTYIRPAKAEIMQPSKEQAYVDKILKKELVSNKSQIVHLNKSIDVETGYKYQYEFYGKYPEIALNYIPTWIKQAREKDQEHFINYKVIFTSNEAGKIRYDEFKKITDPVIAKAKTFDSDYEKVKYVMTWIAERAEYTDSPWNTWDASLYGCIVNGTANCVGFSEALYFFANKLDIPCEIIVDLNKQHAWNYVKINNKTYKIDMTKCTSSKNIEFEIDRYEKSE